MAPRGADGLSDSAYAALFVRSPQRDSKPRHHAVYTEWRNVSKKIVDNVNAYAYTLLTRRTYTE